MRAYCNYGLHICRALSFGIMGLLLMLVLAVRLLFASAVNAPHPKTDRGSRTCLFSYVQRKSPLEDGAEHELLEYKVIFHCEVICHLDNKVG